VSKELQLSASLACNKNGGAIADDTGSFNVDVTGKNAVKITRMIGPTDVTLDRGAIGDIGFFLLKNLALAGIPTRALIGAITQFGTPGSTTYSYAVVTFFADGSLSVSLTGTTALGNSVLNGSNYNIIPWTAPAGAATYDVYRIAGGLNPRKIATGLTSPTYNDVGTSVAIGSPPAEIGSLFPIVIGPDGSDYPDWLYAGESCLRRANPANMTDIHVKSLYGFTNELEFTIIEN
jgi:hypothetical protein